MVEVEVVEVEEVREVEVAREDLEGSAIRVVVLTWHALVQRRSRSSALSVGRKGTCPTIVSRRETSSGGLLRWQ